MRLIAALFLSLWLVGLGACDKAATPTGMKNAEMPPERDLTNAEPITPMLPESERPKQWPADPELPAAKVTTETTNEFSTESVAVTRLESGDWNCTFSYTPKEDATSVAVVGSFNNWNKNAQPMAADGGDSWTTTVELPAGVHRYKFVVNDDQWIADPLAAAREPDGHGGQNSLLKLGRVANLESSPAQTGDGEIQMDGLAHRPDAAMYFEPLEDGRVIVRLRTFAHDVERVAVDVKGHGKTAMHPTLADELFAYWEAAIPIDEELRDDENVDLVAEYVFMLHDGDTTGHWPQRFAAKTSPEEVVTTPDWVRDAIFYQIMLDRFRNGDEANDPENTHPWTSDWFATQPYEAAKEDQTFYNWFVFDRMYGGDIAGLREKLPYLKELGINALYLNPVFEAEGHHKYNATNYVHIDDDFGTRGDYADAEAKEDLLDASTWVWTESDKQFLALIDEAHKLGIRIIIDGVFNHVGTKHPAFIDVQENGKASRFADWFAVKSWEPFEYEGWAGHDSLPVFAKTADGLASESVKQHIFDVTKRWMDPNGDGDPSDGIDGWRLDVPNEIALPFWAEWRDHVKSINPEAYITGEIWDRADAWLDGEHFDAVMNYRFAEPAIRWALFNEMKLTPTALDRELAELRLAYPQACTYVMQNLVDSHDTDRVTSMAVNPDRRYDEKNRVQDNGPNYDNRKPTEAEYRKVRLVALVQMTYVGAPMIYYGDEVGMWGADDPTCRKPMLWPDLAPYEKPEENRIEEDQLAFYREIAKLRHEHGPLRRGEFQTLLTDDETDVWVFARYDEYETLMVTLCGADERASVVVDLPADFPRNYRRVFGDDGSETISADRTGRITIEVPSVGGVIYHARMPRKAG